MYCGRCGNNVDDNLKYCTVCGEPTRRAYVHEEPETGSKFKGVLIFLMSSIFFVCLLIGVFFYRGHTSKKAEIEAKRNLLLQTNLTDWTEVELGIVSNYRNQIDEILKGFRLNNAFPILEEWEEFVNSLHRSELTSSSISSINANDFPNIKVYISMLSAEGNPIELTNTEAIKLFESTSSGDYHPVEIESATLLSGREKVNIALVADVSGSMDGYITDVKSMMDRFVRGLQYDVGDEVCLIAFSQTPYEVKDFSSSVDEISAGISSLSTDGKTAFYDALYGAVSKSSFKSGAKCVIAYTDGIDNASSYNVDDVIGISKRYHIPIFIIGIGEIESEETLTYICSETGGSYQNVNYGESLDPLYSKIYGIEKGMYLVSYKTDSSIPKDVERSLYLSCLSEGQYAHTEVKYSPTEVTKLEKAYESVLEDRTNIDNDADNNSNNSANTANEPKPEPKPKPKPIAKQEYTTFNGLDLAFDQGEPVPQALKDDVFNSIAAFLTAESYALYHRDPSHYVGLLGDKEYENRKNWLESLNPDEKYTIHLKDMTIDMDSFYLVNKPDQYEVTVKERFRYTEEVEVNGQITKTEMENIWLHRLIRPKDASTGDHWLIEEQEITDRISDNVILYNLQN